MTQCEQVLALLYALQRAFRPPLNGRISSSLHSLIACFWNNLLDVVQRDGIAMLLEKVFKSYTLNFLLRIRLLLFHLAFCLFVLVTPISSPEARDSGDEIVVTHESRDIRACAILASGTQASRTDRRAQIWLNFWTKIFAIKFIKKISVQSLAKTKRLAYWNQKKAADLSNVPNAGLEFFFNSTE